jgi:nitric oxide reductase NorD protein
MEQPARHRLLLSEGKPNDVDQYDGRYGLEDMRQAINEAKLQGIFPFCLTIDRRRLHACRRCSACTNCITRTL